jgi:GAF domain-containing protein
MAELEACTTSQQLAEQIARHLAQSTPCFAAGVLLVDDHRGQMVVFRVRPVDDLFVQALQRRLSLSYQLCVGPALAEPEMQVVVHGDSVSGPYEPPKSLLTMPILHDGRVTGMIAIASVFPEVFGSKDLCMMSDLAAQAATALERIRHLAAVPAEEALHPEREPLAERSQGLAPEGTVRRQVGSYVRAIVDLARVWRVDQEGELSDVLRQDLDAIVQNALRIEKLLAR